MESNKLIVAWGAWQAQDIILPSGEVIRGHTVLHLEAQLPVPLITERALQYRVYLEEEDKDGNQP